MRRVARKKTADAKRFEKWRKPLKWGGMALGVAAIIGGIPWWAWQAGHIERGQKAVATLATEITSSHGFTVQDVSLTGRHYESRARILKAVGLKRGTPIFSVSPEDIRTRLKSLPWIDEARVVRRLPDTVNIAIEERQPMALWQRKRKLVLIDTNGKPITSHGLHRFRHLIILAGKDAPEQAATLFALLGAEPELARQVVGAVRVGKRRWNLKLRNGIRVRLPEERPHIAWKRLARMAKTQKLLKRDIKMIDLRLPDRVILEPGDLGKQAVKGGGRNT